ncbi:T-lymphocyte surface antigen Ly-9, partial [Galemys pyrenaicus]
YVITMGPRGHTEAWTFWPFKPQKSQPHVFSPVLWTPLLYLFLGPGASGEDSGARLRVTGMLGGSATFPLSISVDPEIEHVTWNGPHGSLILASPTGSSLLMDKSYQNRVNISITSYSLSLYNLTLKDAGPYKAQINRKNSRVTTDVEFTLAVYEKLREPQITLESAAVTENASCTITLICSVHGKGKDIHYSWTPTAPHASESYGSATLTISWEPCGQELSYTCTARNPVSQSSSRPFFARQFCTGASIEGRGEETVAGLLGESIVLPLELPDRQDVEKVLWIFNTSVINNTWGEIATVDPLIQSRVPDKNEVWVSNHDHSLKIKQLRMENAGPYDAYVCSKTSRVTRTRHVTLLVYQRLQKPKVTQVLGVPEDGFCKVRLACSVEDSAPDVTYRWTSSLQKGTVHEGASFTASWRLGENHPIFNCTASNPVSNSSQMVASEDVCPAPMKSKILLTVILLMVFILSCTVIFGWCIWKKKKQLHGNNYTTLKALRHQQGPLSDSSSDSSDGTDEHEQRPGMQLPVHGTDELCVQFTSEDSAQDGASEGQAEYILVTPDGMAPATVVKGDTVYAQVCHNPQPGTPASAANTRAFITPVHRCSLHNYPSPLQDRPCPPPEVHRTPLLLMKIWSLQDLHNPD